MSMVASYLVHPLYTNPGSMSGSENNACPEQRCLCNVPHLDMLILQVLHSFRLHSRGPARELECSQNPYACQ